MLLATDGLLLATGGLLLATDGLLLATDGLLLATDEWLLATAELLLATSALLLVTGVALLVAARVWLATVTGRVRAAAECGISNAGGGRRGTAWPGVARAKVTQLAPGARPCP